jgi:hypothetical protein
VRCRLQVNRVQWRDLVTDCNEVSGFKNVRSFSASFPRTLLHGINHIHLCTCVLRFNFEGRV